MARAVEREIFFCLGEISAVLIGTNVKWYGTSVRPAAFAAKCAGGRPVLCLCALVARFG